MSTACDDLATYLIDADADAVLPPTLAAHVTTCAACARLVLLPGMRAAVAQAAPTLGFEARATRGAQRKLASRRRARIAWATTGGAAIAATLLFVAMPTTTTTPRDLASTSTTPAPITPALTLDDDALATGLLDLARSTHRTASTAYRHATANLAIYDRLLTPGVTP